MSTIPMHVVWLLYYLVPCALAGGVIVLVTRARISWRGWELALLFLPFVVWTSAITLNDADKTLSNAAFEPFVCGLLSSVQLLVRICAWKILHRDHPILVPIGVLASCFVALAVYWSMPALPE